MTPEKGRELRLATILGFGLGLILGSLAMYHNDPTTASAGSFMGLLLSLAATFARHPARSGDNA